MRARRCLSAALDGLQAWDGPDLPAGVYCRTYERWWRAGRVAGVVGAAGLMLGCVVGVWWLAVLMG